MNESPTAADPDDLLLAEILAQAGVRGDAAILDGIGRHPRLAERIIGLYHLQRSVQMAGPGDSLTPGERLGDFLILGKVGGGGMGEVYEAEQVSLGRRKVALKVIRNDRASEAMRERFRREQRILARLHQTHIVPIHVAGEDRGLHFLVMPFIDGAALHDMIAAVQQQAGPSSSVTTLIEEAVRHRALSRDGNRSSAALPRPQRLSSGYFRLVAGLIADVAEAVEAVHRAGFLHRDLKPGNLMVDRQGKVWIIDFGLACEFAEVATPSTAADGVSDTQPRDVSCVAGTPQYMAPEQREGKADRRSDVWALGATLYELAYLERAADRQGTGDSRSVAAPADLAAICDRALQAEPDRRYATAGDLARDLRRWLAHEPTEARGATLWRWAWLLVRRHPERAAASAGVLLALAATLGGAFLLQRQEAAQARERAELAERHERDQRRQSLLHQIDRLRAGRRQAGWTRQGRALVEEAARLGIDERLRELAAQLDGVDAVRLEWLSGVPASSVAFDREGTRLLLGGLDGRPARLWRGQGTSLQPSGRDGAGPVAFARDGTPLQFIHDKGERLVLWDVQRRRPAREFTLPVKVASEDRPILALTPDAAFVAVAVAEHVVVWDTGKGQPFRLAAKQQVSALALAPDGSLVAAGNKEGRVEVWDLPSGEPIDVELRNEGVAVTSLAFHRDTHRGDGKATGPRWVLAAGSSSSILGWELPSGRERVRCLGSEFDVLALAFSPDGMTLASGGVDAVCLWDVRTGRQLLEMSAGDLITGLAFSPDGRSLACAGQKTFSRGEASVWSVESGRGLRVLRGLGTPISKVRFSPDGRLLAALGHGWEVGIWDATSGHLLHVFGVPRGLSADNAALAFGPDDRFAFAAGTNATLWRLGDGVVEQKDPWILPKGLVDGLAFVGRDRLILTRAERRGKGWGLPVRDLLGGDPTRILAEPTDLYGRVFNAILSPDGKVMVAAGRDGPPGTTPKRTAAYETDTGKQIWVRRANIIGDSATLITDPSGVVVTTDQSAKGTELVDVRTGKTVAEFDEKRRVAAIESRPRDRLVTVIEADSRWAGFAVSRQGGEGRSILLHGERPTEVSAAAMAPRGGLLALGNKDGTVTLWDLDALRDLLREAGLGWAE